MLRMYRFSFHNAEGDTVVFFEREGPHPMSVKEERAIYAKLRETYDIDPRLNPKSKSIGDPF